MHSDFEHLDLINSIKLFACKSAHGVIHATFKNQNKLGIEIPKEILTVTIMSHIIEYDSLLKEIQYKPLEVVLNDLEDKIKKISRG